LLFVITGQNISANCIKKCLRLPILNQQLTSRFWPTRFDVTIETIVLIVTSNMIGQNQPVRNGLSNQFLYTIQWSKDPQQFAVTLLHVPMSIIWNPNYLTLRSYIGKVLDGKMNFLHIFKKTKYMYKIYIHVLGMQKVNWRYRLLKITWTW